MIWVILLSVFLLLLLFVLFIPIVLYVDTRSQQYYLQMHGLIKASVEQHEQEIIRIKLKTFFRTFYFYPIDKLTTTNKKKSSADLNKVKKKGRRRVSLKKVLRMLKTFKVKRFFIDVDTGDVLANARLYPLFALLNYKVGAFNVNFEGRNQMALHLQNRPIYIIKSFINF